MLEQELREALDKLTTTRRIYAAALQREQDNENALARYEMRVTLAVATDKQYTNDTARRCAIKTDVLNSDYHKYHFEAYCKRIAAEAEYDIARKQYDAARTLCLLAAQPASVEV